MKITNVKFFKVPFEYKSQDRIVENVDVKLDKFFVEEHAPESAQIAWNYTDEISGSFTLTSNTPVNYMRVESDLFDKPVYYFLDNVEAIESANAKKYSMKLDVIASFGQDVFTKLNNKEVNIERMHEDRYKWDIVDDPNYVKINLDTHFLINTDFKIPTTKGAEKVYKGSGAVVYNYKDGGHKNDNSLGDYINYEHQFIVKNWFKSDGKVLPEDQKPSGGSTISPTIYNTITVDNDKGTKTYYVYAILSSLGTPIMDGNYHIAPIATQKSSTIGSVNDYNVITKLQEGKVLNIVLSPFPYDYSVEVPADATQRTLQTVNAYDVVGGNSQHGWGDFVFTYSLHTEDIYANFNSSQHHVDDILFLEPNDPHWRQFTALIEKNGLKDTIMDNFKTKLTKREVKDLMTQKGYGYLKDIELGLLNEDICPIYADFGQRDEIVIDIYNMLKDDLPYIGGTYDFTPNGVGIELAISKEQYVKYLCGDMIGFQSDVGKTYLARNKYSMDAQMAGARLNADLQQRQITTGQYGRFGGGPVGGFMNTLNPMNWQANASDNKQADIVEDIATNERNKIIAQANDASATSGNYNRSEGDQFEKFLSTRFNYKFNWYMTLPNRTILKNIYYFMQKSGYLIQDWLEFKEEIWKSREKWNYLQIKNVRDYLDIDQSDSIMDMIEDRLDKGVRIWHEDDVNIDYTQNNFEKVLINFANS